MNPTFKKRGDVMKKLSAIFFSILSVAGYAGAAVMPDSPPAALISVRAAGAVKPGNLRAMFAGDIKDAARKLARAASAVAASDATARKRARAASAVAAPDARM